MERRDSSLHPRRRRKEQGPVQYLLWWLYHLVILPADEALAWPKWLLRITRPIARYLGHRLGISERESIRAWVTSVLFIQPTVTPSPRVEERRRPPMRHPGAMLDLLSLATRPLSLRLRARASLMLNRYADQVGSSWQAAETPMRAVAIAIGLLVLAIVATTPLSIRDQLLLGACLWVLALAVRRITRRASNLILIGLSVLASLRYIWWRVSQTLDPSSAVDLTLGIGLLAAEAYTWTILLIGFLQNARPLGRQPVALPTDVTTWPAVDVMVPTYNEPLSVIKPTVLAALSLDWPADRLQVCVLDDGAREEVRVFAESVGARYIARTSHEGAKAGNINHALKLTTGEFVAIFDCDHIPVRAFLTTTLGWMVREPQCALVQTPHHFFSPDPFERNLGTFRQIPSEGGLFYGLVQEGNDFWNAAFFCGSCAVLRREPLMAIGGLAAETVTEDAHTALRLHRHGCTSAYLRCVLAGGLAVETFAAHVKQRIRWARGMAQIFRLDNPFSGKGLKPSQRLCYANAMLHFFGGLPRLVFLTAPLAYLYFKIHLLNASALLLAAYALPHLLQSAIANANMQGRFRHTVWNEAYETALSWYIAIPTLMALINPKGASFNVTAKGGRIENDFYDWRIAMPYLVLALANLGGIVLAVPSLLFWNAFESGTVLVNLVWALFNFVLLGVVLGVAAETSQRRTAHRVTREFSAVVELADGQRLDCSTVDFSMTGLRLRLPPGHTIQAGDPLRVILQQAAGENRFPGEVLQSRDGIIRIRLDEMHNAVQRDYVQCTFARADVWQGWNDKATRDKPLRSLAEVLSFGIFGYRALARRAMTQLKKLLFPVAARTVAPATVRDRR